MVENRLREGFFVQEKSRNEVNLPRTAVSQCGVPDGVETAAYPHGRRETERLTGGVVGFSLFPCP